MFIIIKLLQTGIRLHMVFCSNRFVSYINNLPEILIGNSKQILVADNTSVVIANSNIVDFQSNIKAVF